MIVQCKNCGTKFKFDETMIEGEGVWGRCSQCKNVFFLDNPVKEESSSSPDKKKIIEAGSSVLGGARRQDVKDRRDTIKKPEPEFFKEMEKDSEDIDTYKLTSFEKTEGDEAHEEVIEEEITIKHGFTRETTDLFIYHPLARGNLSYVFY